MSWKAMGSDAKPAGTRSEQGLGSVSFKERKELSKGDAAHFPALALWKGQVSMILLANSHVHSGKCT